MNNNKNKRIKKKYSIFNPSPRLLQTLKKISMNQGGTVSYVFVEERIRFTKKHPKGETYKVKSSTSSPINPESFYKEVRGKLYRRSPQEMLELFEDIRHDLGASYFVIN